MGDPIWHGYDQAALDDQYKASGTRIRNPEEYLARWRADPRRHHRRATGDDLIGLLRKGIAAKFSVTHADDRHPRIFISLILHACTERVVHVLRRLRRSHSDLDAPGPQPPSTKFELPRAPPSPSTRRATPLVGSRGVVR